MNDIQNLSRSQMIDIVNSSAKNMEEMPYRILLCRHLLATTDRHTDLDKYVTLLQTLASSLCQSLEGNKFNQVEEAISLYTIELDIWTQKLKTNKDDESFKSWVMVHHNLANAYTVRLDGNIADNLEKALEYSQIALDKIPRHKYPLLLALIYSSVAACYKGRIKQDSVYNQQQAIACYEKAHDLYIQANDKASIAMVTYNLGSIYRAKLAGDEDANYKNVLQYAHESLAICKELDLSYRIAMVSTLLGHIYTNMLGGKIQLEPEDVIREKSIEYFTSALKFYESVGIEDEVSNCNAHIGLVYKDVDPDRALNHFIAADTVTMKNNMPLNWASIQSQIADIYIYKANNQEGDYCDKALRYYTNALGVASQHNHLDDVRLYAGNIGDIFLSKNNYEQAIQYYDQAVQADQAIFKDSFTLENQYNTIGASYNLYIYNAYCYLMKANPVYLTALLLLERGKARQHSSEVLQSGTMKTRIPQKYRFRYSTLRNRIIKTRKELGHIQSHLSMRTPDQETEQTKLQYEKRLQSFLNDFNEFMDKIIPEIQDITNFDFGNSDISPFKTTNALFVYPIITPYGGAALLFDCTNMEQEPSLSCVKNDQIKLNDDQVKKLLYSTDSTTGWLSSYKNWNSSTRNTRMQSNYQKGLVLAAEDNSNNSTLADWIRAQNGVLKDLWEWLVGPINESLKNIKMLKSGASLVVVPQGSISILPMHAAYAIDSKGQKEYWKDHYNIAYAPNARIYHSSRKYQSNGEPYRVDSLFSIVDPLEDLKFSSMEDQLISKYFKNPCSLTGHAIDKRTVFDNLQKFNHVHYSGHAHFNWKNYLETELLLDLPNSEKNIKLKHLLDNRTLSNVRLIILSACETGIAEFDRYPEEHISMASALLQSGASAVIASLWEVDDYSTAVLMQRFYKVYLDKKTSYNPAAALCRAQVWMKNVTGRGLLRCLADEYGQYVANQFSPEFRYSGNNKISISNDDLNQWFDSKPFADPYYWAAFYCLGA